MQAVGVSQDLEFICLNGLSYQKASLETAYFLKKCNDYFSAFQKASWCSPGTLYVQGCQGQGREGGVWGHGERIASSRGLLRLWFVTLSQYLACCQASSRANYFSSRELIREERGRIATWV